MAKQDKKLCYFDTTLKSFFIVLITFSIAIVQAAQPTATTGPKSAEEFPVESRKPRTPAEIARTAFPAVVLLAMQDARGQPISLGSGFFVAKDVVVTNFHVIDGASGGYAKIVGQPTKLQIQGTVGIDPIHDLALLQLSTSSAPTLPLRSQTPVNTGDAVFAIGNPRGLEGTFSQGIVSSVREFGSDRILQITAPISPGSSGGPVLDETGTVVGVSVASIANAQNLNFAIPADYVAALQKTKADLRPLQPLPRAKPRKTLLDQLGNEPPRDGVVGTNLTYDRGPSSGYFSYSLQNQLREPIKDVLGVIVFYNVQGEPLDIAPIQYANVIPPGLAKRVTGRVDGSVETLNSPDGWRGPFPLKPKGKVEFRIFDFSVAND